MSQTARQTAKEDRSENRVAAQLNQQQPAQAGTPNCAMSGGNNTNQEPGTTAGTMGHQLRS